MLYVRFDGTIPVEAVDDPPDHRLAPWQNRNHWKSFEQVCRIARLLSLNTRKVYVGTDEGPNTSPRFDVIEVPKIGEKVSYEFNGDSTPDGEIVKVTKQFQVVTSSGKRYRRLGKTAKWVQTGGTWYLIKGHHHERNPHI